jgi:bifunctional non-homologous end joining protein LigD
MANKGCIEFHLWASKINHINYPDMLIFDLDIHKNTPFENALQVAVILKRELKKIGLRSFPKTSGCTGIHIYVPVLPENTFENIRKWIHIFIKQLEKKYPDLISVVGKDKKTHKRGKVTVDIMQNVISRNTAAPYTARAYPGASVSAPLTWEEMENGGFVPADFNIKNMPRRIKNKGDVFSEVLTLKQHLPL